MLYHCQDPDNFDDPYFDYNTFVNKNVTQTSQDDDPDETDWEMKIESEESSDTEGFWFIFSIYDKSELWSRRFYNLTRCFGL